MNISTQMKLLTVTVTFMLFSIFGISLVEMTLVVTHLPVLTFEAT
jgi:hypothetical protein